MKFLITNHPENVQEDNAKTMTIGERLFGSKPTFWEFLAGLFMGIVFLGMFGWLLCILGFAFYQIACALYVVFSEPTPWIIVGSVVSVTACLWKLVNIRVRS